MKSLILFLTLLISISSYSSEHKNFNRVFQVIFENAGYDEVIRQPFFSELATKGVLFQNMTAVTHPSQGNYIALTSGSASGVQGDSTVNLNVRNIVDLLESKGISWKVYAEDFPGNCFTGATYRNYVRKHNPFISYVNIQKNPNRCSHIVNANEFDQDVKNNTLAEYIFYVPDMNHDGHETNPTYSDRWYQSRFAGYFSDMTFMRDTLVITTFDENDGAQGNQIYTSFYGPMVRPGLIVKDSLNHYSVLKVIEDNWGLGNLSLEDATANSIPNIWR